jgi:hypothetical protein
MRKNNTRKNKENVINSSGTEQRRAPGPMPCKPKEENKRVKKA